MKKLKQRAELPDQKLQNRSGSALKLANKPFLPNYVFVILAKKKKTVFLIPVHFLIDKSDHR